MRDRSYDEGIAELFRKDISRAVDLLNDILEDDAQAEALIVLRQLTLAFGGVRKVADKANLNPNQLYRTLSATGNPELRSLTAILSAMGLQLSIKRKRSPNKRSLKNRELENRSLSYSVA